RPAHGAERDVGLLRVGIGDAAHAELAQPLRVLARVLDVAHQVVPAQRQERQAQHDTGQERQDVRGGELARRHRGLSLWPPPGGWRRAEGETNRGGSRTVDRE
ncbi:MAG: hypothetical protein ACK559_09130, partial [bacterium]